MDKLGTAEEQFILHWGEMSTRWGINRSMAQIHALLYLSPEPLNAEQIAATLALARSNVSTNLRELQARGARLFAIASPDDDEVASLADTVIALPDHHAVVSPMLTVIPLQLYAYWVARELGREIDKPRNLAKSVTVT